MPKITEDVEIAASPADVFRLCHDFARRPEWDERITRMALITPAPVRRGTLVQVDFGRSGKFLFSWEGEYADFQYPSNSTLKVLDAAPSSPFRTGSERWEFAREGSGTRLTVTWDYRPRHFLARIADALWQRAATRRTIRRSLANLKALIESS